MRGPKLDVVLEKIVEDEFAVLRTNISCKEFAHAFANGSNVTAAENFSGLFGFS